MGVMVPTIAFFKFYLYTLQVPHDETASVFRLLTVSTQREGLYHVAMNAFRCVETVSQKAFDMTRILDEGNSRRVEFYLSPMTTPHSLVITRTGQHGCKGTLSFYFLMLIHILYKYDTA